MDSLKTSEPIGPVLILHSRLLEFEFPDSPSFDNPLVGIETNVYGYFNFLLKDGSKSS